MKTVNIYQGALLGALTAFSLCAQETIVLESFEDGISAVSLMDWGGRPAHEPVGVELTHYTRTSADDPNVTQGEKSLKVTLSGLEWWSADFQVTLSEAASELVRDAANTGDVAQYILRWDIVFPPSGTVHWMNSQIQSFGGNSDQLEYAEGRRTMSIALDLIDPLPAEGPLVLMFAQNFDAMEDPFGSLDIHMDNIRLVNTYVPDAQPKFYVLQSFEDSNDPTGGVMNFTGWGGGQRTTYHQYPSTGAEDVRVSHGSHSLEVRYSGAGTWGSDWLIPFDQTMLAEILKLDLPADQRPAREELARYTLRWDVTWPERATDWTADWMNTAYHTQQEGLPWAQNGAFNTRSTYSITLDQITWADWGDYPIPSLMVLANGPWGPSGNSIWFDNFVLIDTGDSSGIASPTIVGYAHDPASGDFTLTWGSSAGTAYAVDRTTDPGGSWTTIAESVLGQGATTSYSDTAAPSSQAFYRVAAFPPPPLFETSFEPGEDLSGWTEVITVGQTQWQVGVPTSGPGSAHTGTQVLATKLAGDYDLAQEVGYRSPIIDLTGRQSATLQFFHWYEFEPQFEGRYVDWGEVNLLDAATGQNLLSAPALRFVGAFRNWRRTIYNLPAVALDKRIRIEFKLVSDDWQPAPGWYIDDVRID